MNILEYIDYLMDECGWTEEAAAAEADRAFGPYDGETFDQDNNSRFC